MIKKTKHLFIIAIAFMLSISFQVNATEYFVAEGGTGTGTEASPFGTLAQAIAVAVPHDIITLRAGTYDAPGDTYIETPHLTIQGYPGERPHITNPYSKTADHMAIWVGATAHHFTLRNLEISGGRSYTLKFDTYWDYPAGGDERARYALIEDCEIHSSGTDIVKITPECDNMTFINCEVHHSGLANLAGDIEEYYPNCQGIDDVNADSLLITQCYIHDIPYDNPAVFFKGGAIGCVIERSLFENSYAAVWMGAQTDYDFFSPDVNPEYFNCIDGIVRNNIIKNMRGEGIAIMSAKNPRVYNNTLIDCGNGDGDMIALGFRHQVTWNGSIPTNAPTVNPYIVNNVIVKNPSNTTLYKDFLIEFSGYNDANGQIHAIEEGSLQMYNNRYYDENHTDIRVRDNNNIVDYNDHTTLVSWQASPLHNSSYADINSVYADPMVDIDGRPQAGSNCLETGVDIIGLTEDYYGNPRPAGAIDIGAVQVSSTVVTTYTLAVNATNGSVAKVFDKPVYPQGETVTLTATPEDGYKFDNWSGDASGTSTSTTVVMNSDKTVTANFSVKNIDTFTITITSVNGTITKSPDKSEYNEDETITLTATPDDGYQFDNWSGDASGTSTTTTVVMSSNKTVTANFSKTPSTGVNIESLADIVLAYPNPGTGRFNINFTSEYIGNVYLKIITLDGRQVEEMVIHKQDLLFSHIINIENQKSGMYIIKLIAGDFQMQLKLIKK